MTTQPEPVVQPTANPASDDTRLEGQAPENAPVEPAEHATHRECGSCGQKIPAGLMFCPKCGGSAEASASEEAEREEAPASIQPEPGEKPPADKKDAVSEGKGKGVAAKALAVILGLALVAAAGTFLSHQDKAEAYETAMQMYDSWQIEEAKALFSDLGDFEDSQAMVAECDDILQNLDDIERNLTSGDYNGAGWAWSQLADHKGSPPYDALAEEHGGYPAFDNLCLLWETSARYGSYLFETTEGSLTVSNDSSYSSEHCYSHIALSLDSEEMGGMSLDELIATVGFGEESGEGTARQRYAYSKDPAVRYEYSYKYGTTTLGGEDAIWIAVRYADTSGGGEGSACGMVGCVQLQGRSAAEVAELFATHCEYSSLHSLRVSEIFYEAAFWKKRVPRSESELAAEQKLIEYGSAPASSSRPESSSPSSNASNEHLKDQLITDTSGKQVYKVHAYSSTLNFTGSYQGSGNFIVKVLDSNQDLDALVCNEIGDHVLDKRVSVTKGYTYYIQIEWNNGSWNMQWTGTYGS